MSYRELLVSPSNIFGGLHSSFEKSDYVVLGVPFDVTSTYRTGARFGPTAIRQASTNIETFSFRTGLDLENLRIHDLGDLHVSSDTSKTLKMLELVVKEVSKAGKVPAVIGGEHTITYGIAKGRAKKGIVNTALVSFDAHLDLRNEYSGLRMSHTTFMRRISEEVTPAKIIEVGTRAVCREELEYAKHAGIEFLTTQQVREKGSKQIAKQLREKLSRYKRIYISVDMDVLDPAFVPAVQNPEGDGLEMHHLLDILGEICDKRVIGFDVVEIAPDYDQGISAVQAGKVILEILCKLERSRKP